MNRSITLSEKDIERFWRKVERKNEKNCWEWMSYKFKKGYGGFQIKTENLPAHRVAWVIAYGQIPDNLCVCHQCDNPSCVNPNHLFLGTYEDNNQDRVRKGRSARVVGENNPAAKLNKLQVIEIRYLRKLGFSQKYIARIFNVGKSTIGRIDRGTHWKE